MNALIRRQQLDGSRVHDLGQTRLVGVVALVWFVLLGLLPLPYLQSHATVPGVLPLVLACVLISGLLVGDLVWHHAENGFEERTGTASASRVERRRLTLSRFMIVPLALPSIDVLFDIPQPGKAGVVLCVLGTLAVLVIALVLLERSMRRAG